MSFGKPQRLEHVFRKYEPPLYFVTFCAAGRASVLATASAHAALVAGGMLGIERGISLGRYVIMPDRVHPFVRRPEEFLLGTWVAGLKRVVAAAVSGGRAFWQRGFFDHLVRNGESYAQKWHYVQQNPVRAGLVASADQWPFHGEVILIEK
jgi:REP element-mobilizing transposase RayT